jgi:hypothetical protein
MDAPALEIPAVFAGRLSRNIGCARAGGKRDDRREPGR